MIRRFFREATFTISEHSEAQKLVDEVLNEDSNLYLSNSQIDYDGGFMYDAWVVVVMCMQKIIKPLIKPLGWDVIDVVNDGIFFGESNQQDGVWACIAIDSDLDYISFSYGKDIDDEGEIGVPKINIRLKKCRDEYTFAVKAAAAFISTFRTKIQVPFISFIKSYKNKERLSQLVTEIRDAYTNYKELCNEFCDLGGNEDDIEQIVHDVNRIL